MFSLKADFCGLFFCFCFCFIFGFFFVCFFLSNFILLWAKEIHWNGSVFESWMPQVLCLETVCWGKKSCGSTGAVSAVHVQRGWMSGAEQIHSEKVPGVDTGEQSWGLLCNLLLKSRRARQRAPETREKAMQEKMNHKSTEGAVWADSATDSWQQGCLFPWSAAAGVSDEALCFSSLLFSVISSLDQKLCITDRLGEDTAFLEVSFMCNIHEMHFSSELFTFHPHLTFCHYGETTKGAFPPTQDRKSKA